MADVRRLPRPVTDNWNWQMQGACRNLDSQMFFHPERERGTSKLNREQQAKQVCKTCPVIEECRRHALAVEEPYGVWGGLTEAERSRLLPARSARRSRSADDVQIDEIGVEG